MPIQIRKKGVKGQPGTPTTQYGEIKKPVQVTLTPTAIASLDQLASTRGISRSELIERYARSLVEQQNAPAELVKLPLDFVFDDWRRQSDGQSVYGTQEDFDNDLSTGQFHGGTTYEGVLLMDKWAREELVEHIKTGFVPIFWCNEAVAKSRSDSKTTDETVD